MLVTTALALALMSGQDPVVIGNAPRHVRPPIQQDDRRAHLPGPGDERTRGETICREEPVTGSRFPRRVCHTRYEADGERHEGRSVLRRMQGSRTPDIIG